MSRGSRALNLLVGCLVTAAIPGIALAGTPSANAAPAPAAAPAPPPAAAAPPAPEPYAPPPPAGAPQGYPPPAGAPQGYPPPGAYPAAPPPPGYYYPPPAYAPPAYSPAQRLVVLNAEIADLGARREAITLGGPIGLIIGGAAVGLTGIALLGSSNTCSSYDEAYYNCRDDDDEGQAVLGALMFAAGATSVTIGIISSIIRGAKRRHLARQIGVRQNEANALRGFRPQWGVAPTRGGGGALSLAFSF